jgi:hypothetical protein
MRKKPTLLYNMHFNFWTFKHGLVQLWNTTQIVIHHFIFHILGLTVLGLDPKFPTLNYIVMMKKCEEGCIVGGGEEKQKVFKTCYFIEL